MGHNSVADFSDYHQSRQSLLQERGGGFKLNLRSTIDEDYNGTLPQISIIDLKSRNDSRTVRKNQTYLNTVTTRGGAQRDTSLVIKNPTNT